MQSRKMKLTGGELAFKWTNDIVLFCVLVITLLPLLFVLNASISDTRLVLKGKVLLIPKGINFQGYKKVLEHESIMRGYINSIYYSLAGTAVNIIMTVLCAFPLSRKNLAGRGLISGLIVFTMYFSGGMIPTYLVVSKWLRLKNTVFAIILPGAISVYNMIIVRSYFMNSIPEELNDAALIDGCTYLRMLLQVVLPLSVPVLAVVTMYYLVGHWNSWFSAMIYLTEQDRYPLQLVLKSILVESNSVLTNDPDVGEDAMAKVLNAEAIKYAVIVVASAPVLAIYPFLQRFFVKGIMVGALKG